MVQLATIALDVQDGAEGLTYITGDVLGLVTCIVCDGSDDNDSSKLGAITAGSGFADLSSGRRRRLLGEEARALPHLAATQARRSSPRQRSLAGEGTCCSDLVAEGSFFRDVNGNCTHSTSRTCAVPPSCCLVAPPRCPRATMVLSYAPGSAGSSIRPSMASSSRTTLSFCCRCWRRSCASFSPLR